MEHVDVLIVGAGQSGIGAAWHLQTLCPQRSYAIVEARDAIGGTWDLFRYPGIRSDSDMKTLGYRFKPWTHAKPIADGASIRHHVNETARENGIETFGRQVVHPQHWTEDIDYSAKRVVIVGSGATAVTLLPELAKKASHVTMLQRSPTYVVARPAEDALALSMRRYLPESWAYTITRWKRLLGGMVVFRMCRKDPVRMKRLLRGGVRQALGPDYDVERHFTPRYNPWKQHLCLIPDGDMFRAIRSGATSVVTDHIAHFNVAGIALKSGAQLDADLVVTASGLNLQSFGGLQFTVEARRITPGKTMAYKGFMFSDRPNFTSCFGYTDASWTLKADLTAQYLCRLLQYTQRRSFTHGVPRNNDPTLTEEPWVDISSGYFQRALDLLPKQGTGLPLKLHQINIRDIWLLRSAKLDDGVLQFAR